MSSSIFYSSEFSSIINSPSSQWTGDESQKKIISISRSVINHMRSSELQKGELKLLAKFITKMRSYEESADSQNKLRLNTYVFALETLGVLKSTHPHLTTHPFIYELLRNKHIDSIKDPLDFYVKLIDFQNDFLIPAIKNAKTMEEYEALSSIVDECSSSAKKLRQVLDPPAALYLNGKEEELLNLWNARALQLEPMYQALLQYTKGTIGNLSNVEDRTKLIKNIRYVLKALHDDKTNPNFTRAEKTAIYQAIKTLETEFSEAGHPVQFPTKSLMSDLGISPVSAPRALPKEDLATIQRLSKQIIDLKPTIGDANAYPFSAAYGTYIDDAKTKQSSIAMLAAGMRANAKGVRYSESPDEIVRLGRDLLSRRSGQCDHMAAAVIAKIVEHIQKGGRWDSDVELAGNGGHSFVIINRLDGETSKRATWENAVIVDTWLGSIGVHPNYREEIPSPKEGVISDPKDVIQFARVFGVQGGKIRILNRLSAQELRALSSQQQS